ncbi:MAG TPA: zf-HC2 domain-containing protein [Gemmatimonadaceae bacterium]|nr:zf-HC2 domain-containing protein [Gemmatimonadaceae bacterium]
MLHPDEGTIHAWLDGELRAHEAAPLEEHLAGCADCAGLVAEARGLVAASSRIVRALDIVPADVIPPVIPVKKIRPWYASAQIRAAAAVLFVAGASLVLLRSGRTPKAAHLMREAASTPAAVAIGDSLTRRDTATNTSAASSPAPIRSGPLPQVAAPPFDEPLSGRRAATTGSAVEKREKVGGEADASAEVISKIAENIVAPKIAADEKALGGRVADKLASSAAPAGPTAPPEPATPSAGLRSQTQQLRSAIPTDQVIVTGIVTTTSGAGFRQPLKEVKREVKADTTGSTVITVYEVSPGMQVTLIEFRPRQSAATRAEALTSSGEARKQAIAGTPAVPSPTAIPAPPVAPVASSAGQLDSLSWKNRATARAYTLKGPFTKAQLEALRQRLPEGRR